MSENIFGKPYKVTYWRDSEQTGAEGWVVIDRLTNGVSGGGLFMHQNATKNEVLDLSKSMSLKNSLQEPIFGGAKGGIKFDPNHKDALGVLSRFLKFHKKILLDEWCTGADLNTRNEDIFNITKNDLGVESPFISLAKMVNRKLGYRSRLNQIEKAINLPVSDKFKLGSCITGFALGNTIKLVVDQTNNIEKHRVIIQGFGKVGQSCAYYLKKNKIADVVGIQELDWAIYNNNGIELDDLSNYSQYSIHSCELSKEHKLFMRISGESERSFASRFLKKTKANIFTPCACRYSLDQQVLGSLLKSTFIGPCHNYIISGANNVFKTKNDLINAINSDVCVLPEWVSNSGNAIFFLEALKAKKIDTLWAERVQRTIFSRIEKYLSEVKHFMEGKNVSLYEACCLYSKKRLDDE